MKNICKKYFVLVSVLSAILLFSQDLIAQPPPPGGEEPPGGAPINGLLWLGILIGSFFGARKLRSKK